MAPRSRPALRVLKWLLATALAGATAAVLLVAGLYLHLSPQLPDIEQLQDVQFQEPLRVYARDGELLAVYGTQQRIPLKIDAIPEQIQDAFIAAEDDRFHEHPGVDWMGLTRAAWNLVLTGEKGQGGSTITMQVARNFFLSREKTYLRKLNEILLALKIERHLTKDQVLELYLNKIYLGERAYGVGAAAQIYYGKDIDELTLAETAMIAGLPKAPSFFNPVENEARALQRRDYVLRRMRANEMITELEFRAALAGPVTARAHSAPIKVDAPYVGELARLEAVQRFGDDVYTGGYRIYTTVDAERQRAATAALRRGLVDYERRHGYTGAVARVDPERLPAVDALRAQLAASTGDLPLDLGLDLGLDPEPEPEPGPDPDPPVAPAEQDEEAIDPLAGTGVLGPRQMDALLDGHAAVGNLESALVLEVDEEGALVYLEDRGLEPLPWAGMEWAAPRQADGTTGEEPEEPADVLAAGDIVYVAAGGEGLRLGQQPRIEGALVALDPDNGAIRALSGGFDFDRSKFNRVTQARRQPGSNFKPFIYSAALAKGFTPATLVNDAPVVFEDPALEDTWRPENYSGRIFGPTRLREGLVHSRNLVSIRVLLSIGIPYAIDYLQRFGFPEEQLPHDLTLALGSAALTPLQVATGYAVFANSGFRVEPYLVERIENGGGGVVYRANPARACPEPCEAREEAEAQAGEDGRDADETAGDEETVADESVAEDESGAEADDDGPTGTPLEEQDRPDELADVGVPDEEVAPEPRFAERVIEERNAYIVRSMMRDVVRRGTARGARALGRDDIAGKTGTTDDQLDAWFSGFNGSLVASAWVGYDQMDSLGPNETGARAALPMWVDFMRVALADTPEEWPELPPGMVTVRIDPESGEYAGSQSNGAVFEIFRSGNAPQPDPERVGGGSGSGGGNGDGDSDPLF